jgi:hypothetical protein
MKDLEDSRVKRSERLLMRAQKIFGDIVADAWIECWDEDYSNIDMIEDSILSGGDKGDLGYGSNSFILKFTNDKCVLFTSSEWANLYAIDEWELLLCEAK